ncbi:MAG: hypothetical protein ACJAQS_001645 [Porticoccus sp.]|jgi:hypothetical protein
MAEKRKLSDEDLARVDAYLNSGFNVTERKPFRPLQLLGVLALIVVGISAFALLIAGMNNVL